MCTTVACGGKRRRARCSCNSSLKQHGDARDRGCRHANGGTDHGGSRERNGTHLVATGDIKGRVVNDDFNVGECRTDDTGGITRGMQR